MKNYDAAFRFRFVEGTCEHLSEDRFRCTEEEHAFQSRQAREKAFEKRREDFIAEAWDKFATVRHKGGHFLWYVETETGLFRYLRPYDASLSEKEGEGTPTPVTIMGSLAVEDKETLLLRDGMMLIKREREAGPEDLSMKDGTEQEGSIKNPDNPLRRRHRYHAFPDEVDPEDNLPMLYGFGMYPDEIIPRFGEWSLHPASVEDIYPAVKDKVAQGCGNCALLVDGDYIEELADEIHTDHRWQNYLDCEHPLEERLRLELNYLFGREKGTVPAEMTKEEFLDKWENANDYDEECDAFRSVTSVHLDYYSMGDSPWGRIPSLLEIEFAFNPDSRNEEASMDETILSGAYSDVCDYLIGDWRGVQGSRKDVFPDGWAEDIDNEDEDSSWEDDESDDPFAEGLPEEETPLWKVMEANGILTLEQRARYARYDAANPGCSRENPIVITEKEDYVGLEYDVLEQILRPVPYRFVDWQVVEQRLIHDGDRDMDELKVAIFSHPTASWNDGNIIMPDPEPLGTEVYWFDITVGFKALDEKLG